MSPEERAAAVLSEMKNQLGHACACSGPKGGQEHCPCAVQRRDIIAKAIRDAESAVCDRLITEMENIGRGAEGPLLRQVATAFRFRLDRAIADE